MLAASSTASVSSAAVAVSVCQVFQFIVVNVSALVAAVTAPLRLAAVTVTDALGARGSLTAYSSPCAAPSSSTSGPGSTTAAVEGSASITSASGASSSSTVAVRYAVLARPPLAVWVIATDSSTGSSSCAAASVTVRAVLQFVVVNVSVSCRPDVVLVSTVTAPASALTIVTVLVADGAPDSRTA